MYKNICLLFFVVLFACNSTTQSDSNNSKLLETEMDKVVAPTAKFTSAEDIVFYNIFSPMDMNFVYENKTAYFNSKLLNPLNNISKYNNSSKSALNLGVYGADLSYLWIFEQTQQALSYLSAIQRLSDQLGIPRDFVEFTASTAEGHSEKVDTLVNIARKAYYDTDRYLSGSEQESSAVLILFGGWIETLYILTNMYNETDAAMASNIATQKYSANSMMTMLQNEQSNAEILEYLVLLSKLKQSFDKFEVSVPSENLVIDKENQKIIITANDNLVLSTDLFKEIKENTAAIRNYIIK